MRFAMLASLLGACAPAIPNGEIACDAEHDCPIGYDCVDTRCWRSLPSFDASSAPDVRSCPSCTLDLGCRGNECVHPCEEGFGACPVGSSCLTGLGCSASECPCSSGEVCGPLGGCFPSCALGPCAPGSRCDGAEYCESSLLSCASFGSLESVLAAESCPVGPNDDFASGTLAGYCCAREGATILPDPIVDVAAGRVVVELMGRDTTAPTSGVYSFTLLRTHEITAPADLDLRVEVELAPTTMVRHDAGVLLEVRMWTRARAVTRYAAWDEDLEGPRPSVLGAVGARSFAPLSSLAEPAPASALVRSLAAEASLAEGDISRVDVALSVWTRGPRVQQPIERFSITSL